jgi:hypothetical protein
MLSKNLLRHLLRHDEKRLAVKTCKPLILLASPRRFERPTPSLGGKCSIRLSYGDKWKKMNMYTRVAVCFQPI